MRDILKGHQCVALDTSFWIYHIEDHPRYRDLTRRILNDISRGRCQAMISELTVLEVLVRPLQRDLQDVADEYEILLDHFPHLSIVPIDRRVILQAASLRAQYGLRTPDALIVATGMLQGATLLLTNDKKWKAVRNITIVYLNDLLDSKAKG